MSAVGMLARSEIRSRWRGAVVLVLLVGIVGAVVLSTLAGARRTDTALERFDAASRSADVSLFPAIGYTPTSAEMNALRRLPDVVAATELRSFAVVADDAPATLVILAKRDRDAGRVVDRDRLIAGRRPNPNAVDEVAVSEPLAAQLHQGVGGTIHGSSYSPPQLLAAAQTGALPESPKGPPLSWRIVGIVRRPLDLGNLAAQGGVMVLTPAFDHAYADRIGIFGAVIRVRTIHGANDVASVTKRAQQIFSASGPVSTQGVQTESVGAQNAIDVLTLALRILAGVVGLAGLVTIAIVLTREVTLANVDHDTLRLLGVTRLQRLLINGPRALLIAILGALLAVAGAVAASPLMPIGVARRADPDAGIHADWSVLLPGVLAVVLVVMLIAMLAAFFDLRRHGSADVAAARRRPGFVASAATKLSPTASAGLTFALEPGRGRTAVPVRSACLGSVLGVLGVVAVLMFSSSLATLATTPRLYGWTWDFKVADVGFNPQTSTCGAEDFGVARIHGVGAIAAVCDNDIQLGGRPVTAWGITPLRGEISPQTVEGRAPRNAHEVALGVKTMHALHKHIGDTVEARGSKGRVSFRIVGQLVLPTLGYPQPLADGAAFTDRGLLRVYDHNSRASRYLLGRYAAGSHHVSVAHSLRRVPRVGALEVATLPVEIDRVRKVNWVPAALAGLLGGLALLAIAHALVTSVRRRRRDLGVFMTLGFDRRQVRATIAWQATILAGVGLVIGVPLGLLVGRGVWRLAAEGLGVATFATTPTLALIVGVPLVFVLVNLLAFFPGRSASHITAADALRSE